MKNIRWDKKLVVGVPRIDHEHRVFVDLIVSISLCDGQTDRERASDLMRELELYAQFHFCSEENIMKQSGYPDLASHAQEHTRLLGRLRAEVRQYQIDAVKLDEIVSFLYNWFALHTTVEDQKLAGYLKAERPQMVKPLSFEP